MEGAMRARRYTTEETVARGEAIYKWEVRSKVESEHVGKYLVMDIATGG